MKTIAVIGTGIDSVYSSRNKKLAQQLIKDGALERDFQLATPYPRSFPRRNKNIIGLVIGTLVVEANIKSRLLLTARLAMGQNRNVFAVPGPVTSPQSHGCHQLIKP